MSQEMSCDIIREAFVKKVCEYARKFGVSELCVYKVVVPIANNYEPTMSLASIFNMISKQEANASVPTTVYLKYDYMENKRLTVGELAANLNMFQGTDEAETIKANGGDSLKVITDSYIVPTPHRVPLEMFPDNDDYLDFVEEMQNIWQEEAKLMC